MAKPTLAKPTLTCGVFVCLCVGVCVWFQGFGLVMFGAPGTVLPENRPSRESSFPGTAPPFPGPPFRGTALPRTALPPDRPSQDRPNSRSFFPLPPQNSLFSSLSGGSSCGILMVFLKDGNLKCARLEFSGCRVKPRRPQSRRGFKKENCGGRGKKARNRGPTLRAPLILVMAEFGHTDFGQPFWPTEFGQSQCFIGMADFGQNRLWPNRLWPNRLWPNRLWPKPSLAKTDFGQTDFGPNYGACVCGWFLCVCACVWCV